MILLSWGNGGKGEEHRPSIPKRKHQTCPWGGKYIPIRVCRGERKRKCGKERKKVASIRCHEMMLKKRGALSETFQHSANYQEKKKSGCITTKVRREVFLSLEEKERYATSLAKNRVSGKDIHAVL